MDIEDLLIQIEQEIRDGKKAMFGNGVTVNPDIIYSLIDQIRMSIPNIIREARYIVSSAEQRKQEGTARAQNIIAEAQKKADEMLTNHEIIKQAEHEAAMIRSQAMDFQKRIREDTARDINLLLSAVEKGLQDNLKTIHGVQEIIEKNKFDV